MDLLKWIVWMLAFLPDCLAHRPTSAAGDNEVELRLYFFTAILVLSAYKNLLVLIYLAL